jgi:uncharacterized peroxidase-related enzyme
MSFLRSLPAETGLLQIFQAFPEAARPLLQYHEVLLRGESPFSAAERELIAAYVSALNNCNYCRAVHSQTAVALGMSANALATLVGTPRCDVRTPQRGVPTRDPANEDVDVRMRPVLDFVRELTLTPAKITASDVDPIYAAGWDDRALHDAVAICALFNLMNRLVNGLGVEAPEAYTKMAAQRLAQHGYAELLELLAAFAK